MKEMLERSVLPDLTARAGQRQVIVSRVLRTWGESESRVAELLDPRIAALDEGGHATIAFLASGIEGIKVRLTARADTEAAAAALLDAEEAEVRAVLGPIVFSREDLPMEAEVGRLLVARGLTLAVAESLTGGLRGLPGRRPCPGASEWFKGGVVAYDSQVKFDLLGVPEGPVVSEAAAMAMADGVRRLLGADVGRGHHRRGRAQPSRRASPRARSGSAWPSATTCLPSTSACPATAIASASSPSSPSWTSCAAGSSQAAPRSRRHRWPASSRRAPGALVGQVPGEREGRRARGTRRPAGRP